MAHTLNIFNLGGTLTDINSIKRNAAHEVLESEWRSFDEVLTVQDIIGSRAFDLFYRFLKPQDNREDSLLRGFIDEKLLGPYRKLVEDRLKTIISSESNSIGLPGVSTLLDILQKDETQGLGVYTYGQQERSELELQAAGFQDHFQQDMRVFGHQLAKKSDIIGRLINNYQDPRVDLREVIIYTDSADEVAEFAILREELSKKYELKI